MSPQCEAVLMTGYESFDAAIDALKHDSETPRPPDRQSLADPSPSLPAPLIDVQRDHIVRTLQLARGNKAVAARLLGVSRRAFYRQLERHGLHQRAPGVRRGVPQPSSEEQNGE
jgi:transcriptional regulator of acetoin/glycerol metabolism